MKTAIKIDLHNLTIFPTGMEDSVDQLPTRSWIKSSTTSTMLNLSDLREQAIGRSGDEKAAIAVAIGRSGDEKTAIAVAAHCSSDL